jgi:hypothetical protein
MLLIVLDSPSVKHETAAGFWRADPRQGERDQEDSYDNTLDL